MIIIIIILIIKSTKSPEIIQLWIANILLTNQRSASY